MWQPNVEGVNELVKLFNDSRSNNNVKHLEIFNVYYVNKFLESK